jgi:hypothetical protein
MEPAPAAGLRDAGDRRRYGGRGHLERERWTRGTLIRHARRNELEASTVGALMIAMVEPPQFTGLMARARSPQRPPARFRSTRRSTVDLAAIATPAQVEDRAATPTSCLPKAFVHRARASANAGR